MLKLCTTILLICISFKVSNTTPTKIAYEEVKKELTFIDRVVKVLQDSGYSKNMQEIILAKADLESGTFKNQLTRDHNNIFSMLHSKYDPYSKCGCGFAEGRLGYASYPTIEYQVYAYIWYTKKRHYPKEATPSQYVRFMKSKGYFEATEKDYLNGLLGRLKKYRDS